MDYEWIGTYSGVKFFPLEANPKDICLVDIAHALSNICRFNGHSRFFYSVGQHCILVSQELKVRGFDDKTQLYGLLHDAAEAYLCDLPRPIKHNIAQYEQYEKELQQVIWKAFKLAPPDEVVWERVKAADDDVMYLEVTKLFDNPWIGLNSKIGVNIEKMTNTQVKGKYVDTYFDLLGVGCKSNRVKLGY